MLQKYEHMCLYALLTKGHATSEAKVGCGVRAFQARCYKTDEFVSRCFFLIRDDGTSEDFSFRKCIINLMDVKGTPLDPDTLPQPGTKRPFNGNGFNNKSKNSAFHGSKSGRGGRGRGGRGRGGMRGRHSNNHKRHRR